MAVPEAIKQAGSVARSGSSAASMATALHPAVRWGGIVAIVAGAAVAGFALPKAQPKAQPIAIDEGPVLAADKALADAIRIGDKVAARRLLALQFTFVDADGKAYPRKDLLADSKRVAAAPAKDVQVRSYGTVALVTGQHKSDHDADVFFLDVWIKQKGAWRALLMQDVPLGAADAVAALPAPIAAPQPYECRESLPDGAVSRALSGRAGCDQRVSVDDEGSRRS